MNRAEIIALAKRAQTDLRVARGPFRKLAIDNGFGGARGGWIYRDGRSVTQGWQALANLVVRGSVRFEQPVTIDARPTNSYALGLQKLGRVLREQ